MQQFPVRTYSFPNSALDTPFSAGPEQQFIFGEQIPAALQPQDPASPPAVQQPQISVTTPAAQPQASGISDNVQLPLTVVKKRKLQVDRQMAADNQARVALNPHQILRPRNTPNT